MDLLVWSAARRLAMIVAFEVALVGLAVLRDARIQGLEAVCGVLGLALFAAALPSLARATHIVRASRQDVAADALAATSVYRTSVRKPDPDHDAAERAVVRHAAAALMLLAAAGAVTVVAAASR